MDFFLPYGIFILFCVVCVMIARIKRKLLVLLLFVVVEVIVLLVFMVISHSVSAEDPGIFADTNFKVAVETKLGISDPSFLP